MLVYIADYGRSFYSQRSSPWFFLPSRAWRAGSRSGAHGLHHGIAGHRESCTSADNLKGSLTKNNFANSPRKPRISVWCGVSCLASIGIILELMVHVNNYIYIYSNKGLWIGRQRQQQQQQEEGQIPTWWWWLDPHMMVVVGEVLTRHVAFLLAQTRKRGDGVFTRWLRWWMMKFHQSSKDQEP